MSEAKHTAGPVRVVDGTMIWPSLDGADGEPLNDDDAVAECYGTEAEANAARLCHVWNNFDAVVEALVDAGGWIDSLDASVMCNTNRGFLVSQKIKSALRLARPAAEGVDRG